ncbi:uncharacterized protein MYCGRDRAFT_97794 [Zymoseptoria tritici IPO323]|uniref:Uncharacterized protein n=1 Tax=Zymoseptoria tritici (strain CBS 115943 / IPO323) TaxID=336722 RepID=F9XRE2_ZYMTI|nr:uncharacterized protein MYCGRDRAFT_97794 [Zymoseptoria tritici IPO323]EGP82121.1 hypothetical protein MYCGRDRAFT_97794 [Zymoseptoria tritici IPO323]
MASRKKKQESIDISWGRGTPANIHRLASGCLFKTSQHRRVSLLGRTPNSFKDSPALSPPSNMPPTFGTTDFNIERLLERGKSALKLHDTELEIHESFPTPVFGGRDRAPQDGVSRPHDSIRQRFYEEMDKENNKYNKDDEDCA